jgi:hypothetical protein
VDRYPVQRLCLTIVSYWLPSHHKAYATTRKAFWSRYHLSLHSLTPLAWSFDFSGYEIEEEHLSSGGKSASFAEGLFKAIVFTRSTSWIKLNTTVPDTEHWREWLRQAELAANQCRTSDDIVEEVPMPRALRRHGYVLNFAIVRIVLIVCVVCHPSMYHYC